MFPTPFWTICNIHLKSPPPNNIIFSPNGLQLVISVLNFNKSITSKAFLCITGASSQITKSTTCNNSDKLDHIFLEHTKLFCNCIGILNLDYNIHPLGKVSIPLMLQIVQFYLLLKFNIGVFYRKVFLMLPFL